MRRAVAQDVPRTREPVIDCEWHFGAWLDVLNLPVPEAVAEVEREEYRRRLAEYIDRCAMVLEDWDRRDAQWLGEFRWRWLDYEQQLGCLYLDVEGFSDLRLFLWVNDFAYGRERAIHVLAADADGEAYLHIGGLDLLRPRRSDVIAQLPGPES